jgi:hypothetical protein
MEWVFFESFMSPIVLNHGGSMVTYMNSDKRYVGLTIWSLLFTRHLCFDWDMSRAVVNNGHQKDVWFKIETGLLICSVILVEWNYFELF